MLALRPIRRYRCAWGVGRQTEKSLFGLGRRSLVALTAGKRRKQFSASSLQLPLLAVRFQSKTALEFSGENPF